MIHKFLQRDRARALSRSCALDIFKAPHITEKALLLSESNKLVLKVALNANKIDIKKAVEMIFEIPVESVNTLISKSKTKMFRGKKASRSPFKKAIIQIKKGFDINKIIGAEQ